MRREQGLLIGFGMQMLSHADNLRMTATDDRFFARWSGQQARELRLAPALCPTGPYRHRASRSDRRAARRCDPGHRSRTGDGRGHNPWARWRGSTSWRRCFSRRWGASWNSATSVRRWKPTCNAWKTFPRPRKTRFSPAGIRNPKRSQTFNGRLAACRPGGTQGCYFRLQQGQGAVAQGLQPGDQAGAPGCRGRPQRLGQIHAVAPGRGEFTSPGPAISCSTATPGTRFPRRCCEGPFPWSIRMWCFFPRPCGTTSRCGIPPFPMKPVIAAARDAGIHDEILRRPAGI